MPVVGVGVVEDGLLKVLDGIIHLVRLDMGFELREVVNGALAVGGSDEVRGILPNVQRDLAPRGLDGSDGVGQRTVLSGIRQSLPGECSHKGTYHVEQDSVREEGHLDDGRHIVTVRWCCTLGLGK